MRVLGTIAFIVVMVMAANWRPMDGPVVALGFIFGGLGLLFGLAVMGTGVSVIHNELAGHNPRFGMAAFALLVGLGISAADIAATHWFLQNCTDFIS